MNRVHFPLWSVAHKRQRGPLLISLIAILLVGALLDCVTAQVATPILYVDVDAIGAGDGTSWPDAYVHLQDALDRVNAATNPAIEIWVAAGIYYPDADADGDHLPGSRDESFTLVRDGVQLYGGFDPGSGVTAFDQRDSAAYSTVLSGDVDRNDPDTDGNGIAETWLDVHGANAYHVVYLDGRAPHPITGATVVDGFVITAGQADAPGTSYPLDRGGGLYCRGTQAQGTCSPALAALALSGNQATAGGGIAADGSDGGNSSPTLESSVLAGNRATGAGGGMYNDGTYGTAGPSLSGVTFDGNEAADGGGMANVAYGSSGDASPVIRDTLFQDNSAAGWGGGLFSYPDLSATSNPLLTRVTFRTNKAGGSGGGMLSRAYSGTSSPVLIDVAFERNTSGNMGGGLGVVSIYGAIAQPVLVGVTFHGNSADLHGGGMALDEYSSVTDSSLTNVLFSGNRAGGDGGALYNAGDTSTLTNVTFAANRAVGQGGALANAEHPFATPQAVLINGIVWGNDAAAGAEQIYDAEGASTVRQCVVQAGFAAGTGIVDADPLFVRAPDPGADGAWGTGDDDYGDLRLSLTSPGIDAGDDLAVPADTYDLDGDGDTAERLPFDLDGSARFVGPVDMGAYESAGSADLAMAQSVSAVEGVPGSLITYTLTFLNHGPQPATGVAVTDVTSLDHLSNVSYEATLPVTPLPGVNYGWHVAALAPQAGGTIRLSGVLANCLAGGTVVANTAGIGAAEEDTHMSNNVDEVGLTVLNVPPVAHTDVYTAYDGVLRVAGGASVLNNDVDANCDPLTAILVQDAATGTLHLDVSGRLIYTAPVGFEDVVTFVYQATDGKDVSAPVTSQIRVRAGASVYRVFLPITARK